MLFFTLLSHFCAKKRHFCDLSPIVVPFRRYYHWNGILLNRRGTNLGIQRPDYAHEIVHLILLGS